MAAAGRESHRFGGVEQYDGWMGLCHEFGSQIRAGCDHPMRAGASACSCAECGVVCRGPFDGCPDVRARGPRPVAISATRAAAPNGAPALASVPTVGDGRTVPTSPRPAPGASPARTGGAPSPTARPSVA